MSDILILGYYGFKNSGDDALLLSVIEQLKKEKSDIKLSVLSNDPEDTEKNYGVPAVKRYSIISLLKSIITTKMLLVGGGTLIQDGTSTKSLMYYLLVIRLALMFGKKVMLYANGIGPLKEENYKITRKILNKVDVITLRDSISAEELEKIGVKKPEIRLTADSAFNLEYVPKKETPMKDREYACISVRSYKKMSDNFEEVIAQVCDYIYEKYNCVPVLIPFQKERDGELSERIKKKIKCDAVVYPEACNIEEMLDLFAGARLCIGMRLHSLIYSLICSVVSIGLVYDPKIVGFMEYIGQKNYIDVEKLDIRELLNMVDSCFENYDELKKELSVNLRKMQDRAKENAKIAVRLLNR